MSKLKPFLTALFLALVVVFALQVSTASAEPDWIFYDDGSVEGGVGAEQLAVRFTPPFYPCRVITAQFYIFSLAYPPYTTSFRVHVTDVNHNDLPEFTPFVVTTSTSKEWFTVDLSASNIIITSDDFFISAEFLPWTSGFAIGFDDYPIREWPQRSYGYVSYLSPPWVLFTLDSKYPNILIRAEVVRVHGAPVPEFGFSVPIVTSISLALYFFMKQRLVKKG